jgi:hypothetical protein
MFCPNCGQERISTETSFCSRCGFLLTGTAEIMRAGGALPEGYKDRGNKAPTPRSRGMKQGIFIFLLAFLVVPLLVMISIGLRIGPGPSMVAALLLTVGGLLRIAYAYMFESPVPQGGEISYPADISGIGQMGALPPQRYEPAADFAAPQGRWRDTNDLEPRSVTENTTKLFEKKERG